MTAPGRLATALAVVAVSVVLPFARTPAEPAHPVPTVSFSAMGLSFRYPALETKTSGGWCASLGGTETISVIIPRDQPDNWYGLNACLSASNLPQQEAQISAMLHTVQLAKGDLVRRGTLARHAAPGRGVMNPAALPTMYLV
jgi:hypothetical protein